MRLFPGLPLDLFGFRLTELRTFNARLVNTATPDWILYLAVAAAGRTGIITHDADQLHQDLEARALDVTGITVITYRRGVRDEFTKWGLLMAYAPRIVALLDGGHRGAIILPDPRAAEPLSIGRIYRNIEKLTGDNAQVIRTRSDAAMTEELKERAMTSLWPYP